MKKVLLSAALLAANASAHDWRESDALNNYMAALDTKPVRTLAAQSVSASSACSNNVVIGPAEITVLPSTNASGDLQCAVDTAKTGGQRLIRLERANMTWTNPC